MYVCVCGGGELINVFYLKKLQIKMLYGLSEYTLDDQSLNFLEQAHIYTGTTVTREIDLLTLFAT